MAQQLGTVGRFTSAMYRVGAITGVVSTASGIAYYYCYYKPRQRVFDKINNLSPEFMKEQSERLKRYGLSPGGHPALSEKIVNGVKEQLKNTSLDDLKLVCKAGLVLDLMTENHVPQELKNNYLVALSNLDIEALESIEERLGLKEPLATIDPSIWEEKAKAIRDQTHPFAKSEFSMFIAKLNNRIVPELTEDEEKAAHKRIADGDDYMTVIKDLVKTKQAQ